MYLIKKLSFCFIFVSFSLFGQVNLTQVEYFWDTDPGEGNGIAIAATDGNYNTILENILENSIATPATTGLHTFNIRAQGSNGEWGPINTQVIELSTSLLSTNAIDSISNAEYFWDTDPGEGNGFAFSSEDGNFNAVLEDILETGISVPTLNGVHTFNARVQGSNGNWGPTHTQVIQLNDELLGADAIDIIANTEYFWDTDPGEGNGITFSAEDGNFNSALEHILETDIAIVGPLGIHTFNVRVQDSNGEWGPIHTQVIDIESVLSIIENENQEIQLKLFPNPSSDYFSIGFTNNLIVKKIEVYSFLGKQVLIKEFDQLESHNTIRIDITNLAAASYIVKIKTNKGTSNKLLIKKN